MGEIVVKFKRSDFWDPLGFGGVLRGVKFEVSFVYLVPLDFIYCKEK